MSTFLGGAGGRGGHSSGNSSLAEDVGASVFSAAPFGRSTPAVGGASGSGSWRSTHSDASAQTSAVKSAVEGGVRPKKGGKKGEVNEESKADKLLGEAALKDGEEGDLSTEIMRLYELQRPAPAAIAARQHLVDELTHWLNQERFSWGHSHNPRAAPLEVVPFGSIRFGLSTATSDLDLCLLDPYRPNGFEEKHFSSQAPPRALPDIYNMHRLAASLRRANLTDVTSIADAAVPICKFKVLIDGHVIEADINTNERLGVYNSRLINSYCNLHPLVRPLSVFVKFWAKQRGLNDPSGSPTTFSSYTYILLVISYLQHLDLLPNLQNDELIAQTGTPRNRFFSTPKARMGRGNAKRNRIVRSVGWDVTFVEYDSPPEGYSPPEANLTQLARGFFHYWADEFNMERDIVSVWNGRVPLPREKAFTSQADVNREKHEARKALEQETGIEDAERRRQEGEDDAVAAFAEQVDEETRRADGPALDAAVAQLDAGDQAAVGEDRPGKPDSRSSSPVEYTEYEEPERWREQLLVVQDPFILTRNTAGNVHPDWVEELRVQMRRARDLIDASAPLSTICLACTADPDYHPIAFARAEAARRAKKAQRAETAPARAAAKAAARTAKKAEQKVAKAERRAARAAAGVEGESGGASAADGTVEAPADDAAGEARSADAGEEGERVDEVREAQPAAAAAAPPVAQEQPSSSSSS
ncbi:Proteophosphoglycan 5 [Rhodotorula diobovata]|uniref:polynucleotide adenylyltransferase n=1 Tax=Rhodotorula diobovata TaxID=5288 RepID=A0A5C5FRM4_9BASI|nr:Proteophosphoglycan 5 [Rhodotorula diobovata]